MSRMLKALEELQQRGVVADVTVPVHVPAGLVQAKPPPPPAPGPAPKPIEKAEAAEEPLDLFAKKLFPNVRPLTPDPSPARGAGSCKAAICEMAVPIDVLPEADAVGVCSEIALSVAHSLEPLLPSPVAVATGGPYEELAGRLAARLAGAATAAVALVCLDRSDPLVAMIVPLAEAMAARMGPLLMVDCDLYEPTLADRFATASQQGLLDLLPGPALWQKVIRPTQVAGVDLLPGRRLMAADGPAPDRLDMEPLVHEWLERYRLVLLAAGPLARRETRSLLHCVHGAVLVLEASRTTEDAARRAGRTIRTAGAHLLGTILVERNR